MVRPEPPPRRRPRRPGEEGQALVEFALVLPLLVLLLVGIMQFGMLFYTYIDLTSATRDGARKAAVARASGTGAADTRAAIERSLTVVDKSKITVSITPGEPWSAGADVDVKVSYPYSLDVAGVVLWSGPMTAESISRVE